MKITYTLIFLLLFLSCDSSKRAKYEMKGNKPTISKEKVADLLVQMHIIDASRSFFSRLDSNKTQSLILNLQKGVFDKEQVKQQDYNEAMKYYFQNPDSLTYIYDKVINELQLLQTKENKLKIK